MRLKVAYSWSQQASTWLALLIQAWPLTCCSYETKGCIFMEPAGLQLVSLINTGLSSFLLHDPVMLKVAYSRSQQASTWLALLIQAWPLTCWSYEAKGCIFMEPAGLHLVSHIPEINKDSVAVWINLMLMLMCWANEGRKECKNCNYKVSKLFSTLPPPSILLCVCAQLRTIRIVWCPNDIIILHP